MRIYGQMRTSALSTGSPVFGALPCFARVFQCGRSMAQYKAGHSQRVAEIRAPAAAIPGLYLAGDAYEGIGIPDCIRTGRDAAERIFEQ
jgi:protoporphyrinogen/coproporphyrinogen III oxidase